ncbi:MAG: FAD-dependent oxidoreductase [Oscillospiraceae bacterium]|nr:FAD-dependent oxidoreductase [Oscillospiraceae bacterium]
MDRIQGYSHLFQPLKLGNTVFRNRIFSAPTGLYDLTPELAPTEDYIAYYERKAQGGAASVNIGECYVDEDIPPYRSYEVVHLSEHKLNYNALGKLTDSISRYGAVPTVELQKVGMVDDGEGGRILLSTADGEYPINPAIRCRGLTEEEILRTIDAFASAAVYAKGRGFGMVTVHAGHGWLLQQFLSPVTNRRTDRWGGSAENRARFTVAIIDEIHKRCGKGFPVEVRISGSECFEGGYTIEDGVEIARQLEGHADLIHVSVGNLFGPSAEAPNHPGIFQEGGILVPYAAEIKKHVKTPVATIGALSDPEQLEEIVASGKADVVEMARGLICDPDLPLKLRTGRHKEVRRCLRCFSCVNTDYQHGRLFCAINPASGKEREASAVLPVQKKKVLVAGGGVAGMEAAITAARRGHSVTLCEKTEKLGGVLLCEREVPFKKRVGEYIDRQIYLLEQLGVEVRLNTPVTPALVEELKPEAIVAAIGAEPKRPPIPGLDGENVFTAADVFEDPEKAKGKTLILGAGKTGLELGIWLRMLGKEVGLVEMAPRGAGPGETYEVRIEEYALNIRYETKVEEITSDGAVCETPEGKVTIPADTVVLALGTSPRWEEAAALSGFTGEFCQVGDCREARNLMAATGEAWSAARNIGRI